MPACDPAILRAGDCLLYRPSGLFGWLIAWRTWSDWSHVEVYAGNGESLASRDGIGVGRYPLRLVGLGAVRRPIGPFDWEAGLAWHRTVEGQNYDYLAILRFLLPHVIKRDLDVTRQICAAHTTRLYRAMKVRVFEDDVDADLVSPMELRRTPGLSTEWTDGGSI